MKTLLLLVPLLGSSVSLNVARSRSTSDPCATSPCAQNAICETSPAGLAFCKCRPGHTGDPFVSCEVERAGNMDTASRPIATASTHVSTIPIPTSSRPSVQVVPLMEVVQAQNPTRFTVDYHTSTDQMEERDLSRIPILGDVAQSHVPNRGMNPVSSHGHNRVDAAHSHSSSGPIVHETTVVSGNVRRHHTQQQNHFHSQLNSNSIVVDPMGVYQNCRNINGVVVCADTRVESVPMQTNANPSHSIHSVDRRKHNPAPVPAVSVSTPTVHLHQEHSPSHAGDVCQSACGRNAVCRSINGRAVCGCPADHTGDPSVRCDPLAKEEDSGCQKHIDCGLTEICHERKCIDPCTLEQHLSVCGTNAKCVVVQHTPVCGCQQGFVGNPYEGCVA